MDKETRKALEAAGFHVEDDAAAFLGLTEEERQLVELRLVVSRAVRRRREEKRLTQQQLARKIGSSQSRVAKIEAGAEGVSLDLSFKALFAVGGLKDLLSPRGTRARSGGPAGSGGVRGQVRAKSRRSRT
jgi:DNA-binding XRE family transcriptional regulator